jgi:hypothetical protein
MQMRRLALLFALIGCESKEAAPTSSANPPAASSSSPAAPSTQPGGTSGGRQISSCGPEAITDEGIGELRIGATVESIRQKCNVVRDTTAPGAEGMLARKLRVALSRDTVEAEIVDGRVWRIAVHSPRLRTADSLGVGITLARLLRLRNPRDCRNRRLYPRCSSSVVACNWLPRGLERESRDLLVSGRTTTKLTAVEDQRADRRLSIVAMILRQQFHNGLRRIKPTER